MKQQKIENESKRYKQTKEENSPAVKIIQRKEEGLMIQKMIYR